MTNSRDDRAHGTGDYVLVNGLNMYYEIHGAGQPLVLLHGAFSAIGTSFGNVLPELAKSRRVIAFEMQAHGRTADIDRPLSMEQMADDTVAALEQQPQGATSPKWWPHQRQTHTRSLGPPVSPNAER